MTENAVKTAPEWTVSPGLTDYAGALAQMQERAARIAAAEAPEQIWLLEHPPVITAGTSAERSDLLLPDRFPVIESGRGGQFTYHGPGQRIVYVMLDLGARGRDVRGLVTALEGWAIAALARLGVEAFASDIGTGIWVMADGRPGKIGAIGLRVRRWVSFHGMALNVTTDLSAYQAIVPCGIADHPVLRLADLKPGVGMAALDAALLATLPGFLAAASGARPYVGGLPHIAGGPDEDS
jgi:lipoyl(octanoyl) transferase